MISPEELLAHASTLVRSASEVDTRRAVSAAYYALFHTLARSGAEVFGAAGDATSAQVARAFEHGTMYKVCRSYLDSGLRKTADPRLVHVAEAFVELQDARHSADYDLASTLSPVEGARLVGNCAGALPWPDVAHGQQGRIFLAKLLLGSRLNRRG